MLGRWLEKPPNKTNKRNPKNIKNILILRMYVSDQQQFSCFQSDFLNAPVLEMIL